MRASHPSESLELHEQCIRYETAGRRGCQAIQEFIDVCDYSQPFVQQLLCELIMIDLDHQLQAQRNGPQNFRADPSVLQRYLDAFPEVARLPDDLRNLVVYEFSCLLDFAFHPKITTILQRYAELPGLLPAFRSVFEESEDRIINIQTNSQSYRTHLGFDEIEIGRQQTSECAPIEEIYGSHLRRIVIAARDEKRISRQHLHIQRIEEDSLRMVNTSRRSEFVLNGSTVYPEESITTAMPCEIIVGDGIVIKAAKI